MANMSDSKARAVLELIDPQEVIDLTRRMVAIPSENPPGNEGPVARVLGDYLQAAGLEVTYREIHPDRPNVVATLPEVNPCSCTPGIPTRCRYPGPGRTIHTAVLCVTASCMAVVP